MDQAAMEALKLEHPSVFCHKCDVTNTSEIEGAVNAFVEALGGIDGLVNNAGMTVDGPLIRLAGGIQKLPYESWDKVIAGSLSSVFYMTVNVVEKMFKSRTKGVIVNISSVSANGNAGQTAYCAAKAGVDAMTKTWAKELNLLGIRVCGVAPGFAKTKIVEKMGEKVVLDWNKKIPIRRMAEPSEIAHGVLFALENDYFNGRILQLDGGLIL
jgi:3-oxoacyl-[acyl-carrier protein] reductase